MRNALTSLKSRLPSVSSQGGFALVLATLSCTACMEEIACRGSEASKSVAYLVQDIL